MRHKISDSIACAYIVGYQFTVYKKAFRTMFRVESLFCAGVNLRTQAYEEVCAIFRQIRVKNHVH